MNLLSLLATLALATLLLVPTRPLADDGHGHEHGRSPSTIAGPAQPRFAATSDLFELVGVLDGRRITLYLDRADDNSPVDTAEIELEIGADKLKAVRHGEDAFEVELAAEPAAGRLPVTAMVTVGGEADLLAGELDIHADARAEETHAPVWRSWVVWGAGAVLALTLLVALARRSSPARRRGGAA